MATQYSVDPRCYSLKFPDGKTYPVTDGKVSIDSAAHNTWLAGSNQVRDGWIHEKKIIMDKVPGKYCGQCGFHAHVWSAACPRCGSAEFTKDDE